MFEIGDKVKVVYPSYRDSGISTGMRKYNGKVATVLDRTYYTKYHSHTYTLEGCVSPAGAYYEFVDEWLVAVESEGSDESERTSD